MSDSLKNEFRYDQDRFERRVWAAQRQNGLSRRSAIKKLLGASAIVSGFGVLHSTGQTPPPAPAVIKPTPTEKFRILGSNRETLFEAFKGQGYLTPQSLFFVRNHTTTPSIDAANWRLRIDGNGVAKPSTFSLDDLRKLPSVSLTRFVECAGNGRIFFDTQQGRAAAGTQWRLGAIGVGRWTGVRLNTLLEIAGVKKSAVDLQPEGLDQEVSGQGHVRRPLPIERARDDDVLVVYDLNGEPLPPDHGYPARLLVPGWIGIANIKWLGRIEVSESPLFSGWNTTQYQLFGDLYPKPAPLTIQGVKSAFELPFPAKLTAGRQLLTGRSWSAHGSIQQIEVSFDDGRSWRRADLKQGGNDPQAWAQWEIPWNASAGPYKLKARATDSRGNSQPDTVPFNSQGYLFTGVVAHPVTVV